MIPNHKSEANKAATKAQQLQNEYSQKTMNDRAGIVKENHDSLKHQNYITEKTKGTQIRATNSRNNINAQLDENHYRQYNHTPIKQINGQYYIQDKNGNFTSAINQTKHKELWKPMHKHSKIEI